MRRVCDWAAEGIWPDLNVLLTVPPDVAVKRRSRRADRLEAEDASFHARVAEGFLALARAEPDRWVVIDGTGSVDQVEALVTAAVDTHLGGRG